jgi:mRNA interferase MazF
MKRGEIWLVQLDPTVDREIGKTRPAVIVNDDGIGILPLKVIVPITDWKEAFASRPWMVLIQPSAVNGLSKTSGIDTFQIRSLAEGRLIRQLGIVDASIMVKISQALSTVLALSNN